MRRASTVIAVSDYLRRELEERLPEARGKTEVVDSGVDLDRFQSVAPAAQLEAPAFVHVGSLTERKNVVRLADAFATLGARVAHLRRRRAAARRRSRAASGVRVVGRVPHDEVPGWLAAADVVCGPALLEPFGQALLEALACGRNVVATRVGGPPEFVPDAAGVLVDPLDTAELARALETAASLPSPERGCSRGCRRARRQAAGGAGGGDSPASRSRSASLISTSGPTLSSRPCSRATASACS